ncbi:MAG TPA: EAL domain-containing protein [Candidatus Nanopelagicaceae bacterium]|nr:EAL domain-containing protein [Candidatus Nanopelagicaceae bacterium]
MAQPSPKILIADDAQANVRLLETILARSGYTEVVSTTKPAEVLSLFQTTKPDLLILDLHMPQMDGFEVMAQVRATVPLMEFLPILIMTADTTRPARDRALKAGANDFLTKPVDSTEVTLRVRNLLHTRALNRHLLERTGNLQVEVDRERERRQRVEDERDASRVRIQGVLGGTGLEMYVQPIVDLRSGSVAGMEALARFGAPPPRTPDLWFAEAAAVGLDLELEMAAVRQAFAKLPALPTGAFMAVNVSPQTLCSSALQRALDDVATERVVLELTEHVSVEDYAELEQVRGTLRSRGVRIAIDDTGAGISSLQHVIRLHPDVIKLDRSMIANLDSDPVRRALARALVELSAELGAVIVAEGVETTAELAALRTLNVPYGQGYLLGRPAALPDLPGEPSLKLADALGR